jgi:hypothetical protein
LVPSVKSYTFNKPGPFIVRVALLVRAVVIFPETYKALALPATVMVLLVFPILEMLPVTEGDTVARLVRVPPFKVMLVVKFAASLRVPPELMATLMAVVLLETVIVEPLTMVTTSPAPGITPPTQELATFQSPPVPVLEMFAAQLSVEKPKVKTESRMNLIFRRLSKLDFIHQSVYTFIEE